MVVLGYVWCVFCWFGSVGCWLVCDLMVECIWQFIVIFVVVLCIWFVVFQFVVWVVVGILVCCQFGFVYGVGQFGGVDVGRYGDDVVVDQDQY